MAETKSAARPRRVWIGDYTLTKTVVTAAWAFFGRVGQYQVDLSESRDDQLSLVLDRVSYDGFITAPHPANLAEIVRRRLPVVIVTAASQKWTVPAVVHDEPAVGRLGAEYLLSLGCRRFAFYGVDSAWSLDRQAGFVQALSAAGHVCATTQGRPNAPAATWEQALDADYAAAWVERLAPPVAVMAGDDKLARVVADACRVLGRRIPRDVAILGVDNLDPFCEVNEPALSSVEISDKLGYEAARLLDRMLRGESVDPRTVIRLAPSRVITRQSTSGLMFADPEVAAAMRFIREHACEPIDVAAICRSVSLSRRHLERRFLQAVGHTPFEEIRQQRMEHAKLLLTGTDMSMLEIAVRCGYETSAGFVTAFRERTGSTPTAYRRRFGT